MVGVNILKLFGVEAAPWGGATEADAEREAWGEMPFVSHFADGTLCGWSPPAVEAQDTDALTDHRLGITETAIGQSFGLQLLAHMRRHGTSAQKRLLEVVIAMYQRKHWSNIERGFWGVISDYLANEGAMPILGAMARVEDASGGARLDPPR
jgi:hypothetical protein